MERQHRRGTAIFAAALRFFGRRRIVARTTLAFVAVATLAVVGSVIAQIAVGPIRVGENEQATNAGVYLPTDRSLSRAMERAQERIAASEYQQALTFLQEVLAQQEDSFVDATPSSGARTGIKASARRLIGNLSPQGREAFELLYGAAARRQLDAAVAAGDRSAVAQVVRQYFHTTAGYEAALVLAQLESDAGHPLAAGQLYRELLESPIAVANLGPQLFVLAAVNDFTSGRPADASATLKLLAERDPKAAAELAGRSLSLPGAQSDFASWLAENVGAPERSAAIEYDWLTSHGNAARNVQHPGGGPHLHSRWRTRVVNDPKVEEFLSARARRFAERGVAMIPAAKPIAVGGVVLMRTPGNLVAIDWETGKRIWETREEEGFSHEELSPMISVADETSEVSGGNANATALEQRIWDDGLAMSLASDGERAYILRGGSMSPEEAELDFRLRVLGGGASLPISATNQLVALELATEGKLVWEIDGSRTGPLQGTFFLGPPLAVDNTLYVLAEIRSAIYLLALDSATGRLQWQQQLIGLEQGISLDARRRMAGSTPSYADGLLVCPTAAGVTVAVDVVRRELTWVYQYSRDSLSRAEYQLLLQQQVTNQATRANNRWLDGNVVISDGHAYITPPESQDLHCVDLRTGAELWKRRQQDPLFVGGIEKNTVLLVGSLGVRAVRADGGPAWQDRTLPYPDGVRPAGQGYLSEGRYHLPLSNGAVLAINVEKGEQVSLTPGESGTALGNLICVRGSVISQSPLVVDKFEQIDVLQQRAEAALARNGDDPRALRELAELKRAAGELNQATTLLKKAYQLAPADPQVREMLVEYLLDVLKLDYRLHRDDLPLVRSLVSGLHREQELLRIEAVGLEQSGERLAAWDAYLLAADAAGDQNAQLDIGSDHSVRSDRWVEARLTALWNKASVEERSAFETRVEERVRALGPRSSVTELQQFLERFGGLAVAERVRLQLAARLVADRQFERAELEILRLMQSSAAETRASATALIVKSHIDGGRFDAARANADVLLEQGPSVLTSEGLSGQQVIERLAAASPEFAIRLSAAWPRGRVTSRVETSVAPLIVAPDDAAARQVPLRNVRIEQDAYARSRTEQWYLTQDVRQLVATKTSGEELSTIDLHADPGGRRLDPSLVHGARLGSLNVFAIGSRVLAFDTRQLEISNQPLWDMQAVSSEPIGARSGRGRTQPRVVVYDPRSLRRRDDNRLISAALGPVTPVGVTFHDQSNLQCVDPLTGDRLWSRSDIPRTAELFGDSEYLFAVHSAENKLVVLRMTDGELLDRRPLPPMPWLITASRNIARTSPRGGSGSVPLTVVDAYSGETLFDAKYTEDARLTVVEPNLVAVYETSGKFQVVDVASGKLVIDQKLDTYPKAQNVVAAAFGDSLIVAISAAVAPGRHQTVAFAGDFPLVTGPVYAFDLRSGQPSWPAPAYVEERGFVLASPKDIPLIVFADRESRRDTGAGSMKLRLLCLDSITGQSVFHNDDLLDVTDGRFRIRPVANAESQSGRTRTVAIETTAQQIQLTLSDEPRPPEPPVRDELVARREVEETGIRGALLRATDILEQQQQQLQQQRQGQPPRRARGARAGRGGG